MVRRQRLRHTAFEGDYNTVTVNLDHLQRINICGLLDQQRGNVGEIRAVMKLHHQIDLNDGEKEILGYRLVSQNGLEFPQWDFSKSLPPRAFEITEGDAGRISRALEGWDSFRVQDLRWVESILTQLPAKAESNGNRS